ncbi:Crp/Fnr family transcriptional regulator [Dyadobacter sp. CY356]|uniref:Crp/Fnr family transcriptional regulator n=1 Tax=Dyadobacter sp. CY356 TaxID=2906442 RepID=UPI001F299230|nr:Crp/Fnr family transcriptional regulator [Dyadobacter sp. CY356]MCF0056477.1 Crp/Fnr family transcriptional regulator [Dyadobacter sp. CY356]
MQNTKPLYTLQEIEDSILSPGSKEHFSKLFKLSLIPKGRIILDIGQVSSTLYIIRKGIMRAYYIKGSKDITSWLVSDGDIACIAESFFYKTESNEAMEALEDTWVYAISFEAYQQLITEDNSMARVAIRLLQDHLIHFSDRIRLFKCLGVEERITAYINQPSSLFRKIPDHYIATYLGTTSATFSRCLKKILYDK